MLKEVFKTKEDKLIKAKISKLPTSPGVYFFLVKEKGPTSLKLRGTSKNKVVYIGKATSLRSRVRSYFDGNIGEKRGPLIEKMMTEKLDIKFEKTDSVLEALLLEAELIKKYNPVYNVKGKDQRSWNYIVITEEIFPRVLVMRERELEKIGNVGIKESFGPFPNSSDLKLALKIVRKIFPFRDKCEPGQKKPCFNQQIGLCPGVCIGAVSEKEYAKTIRHIKLFFQGKKADLIKNLEKEMKALAKSRDFEKASIIKKKIFALNHINDIALIKSGDGNNPEDKFRIEAYDISHISGTNIVGVMTVVEGGEIKKSDYRKFNIKGQRGADDIKALSEVFERRLSHFEWGKPDLVVVDGGKAQLTLAERIFSNIKVVSVVKDERHKAREILGDKSMVEKYEKQILLANAESHRFAVAFHRKKRSVL